MTGRVWTVAAVVLVGCRGPHYSEAVPEKIPASTNRNGTEIVIEDRRSEWEKKPFVGAISLFRPSAVCPNPWDQLCAEAGAVVAAMPEKPRRVTIRVDSLRLVRMNSTRLHDELLPGTFVLIPGVSFGSTMLKPEQLYPKGATEHPDGVSCAIEATVVIDAAGRTPQTFPVRTMTLGPGYADSTPYRGDLLDYPVKAAVLQFGRQLRSAVGLPPDG